VNSFLLGLTAVLIVVLGALFAAPLFIDWDDYRPVFEAQATKLFGREVKVGGKVHLVLLPTPELRFDDVKVASGEGNFDEPLLEARSIEAWLNIGALLRGEVEARKIAISDPVLRLVLNANGSGSWADVGRSGEPLPFAPKDVMLDEVSVRGGRLEVIQPEQAPFVIDAVHGVASAASLAGPYKVSATYSFGGRQQEIRLSTSESDADGLFKLKAALRDPDRDTTYLLDGDVTGLRDKPSYDGDIVVRIAPSAPSAPQAAGEPTPAPDAIGEVPIPGVQIAAFELKGALTATPGHIELPNFEIALHAKGRSQMMKGKLALDFGKETRANGGLSGRWVDVDTLLAASGAGKAESAGSAIGVLNTLAEKVLQQARSVGEGSFTANFEQASIGGDLVGGVDVALTARDGAITIDRLKAELPGETRLAASGRLTGGDDGPVFAGPVKLEGSKLRTLLRWAAGGRDMSGQASVGAFALNANATLGHGDLKLDGASGELSGTKFSGALHYRGGDQRLIDLALDSDRLDLREVMGDNAAWRSWLPASAAKPQHGAAAPDLLTSWRDDELHATLRVGELLLPNIPPGRLDAKFSLAKDTLAVERLDFDAEGAIALNGNGRIEQLRGAPAGKVDLSLKATTPEGLRVASELLGLTEGAREAKQLAGFVPLNLEIGLDAASEGKTTVMSLTLNGKAGAADIAFAAKATGKPDNLAEAQVDVTGTISGDQPHAVLSLLIPGGAPDRLAALTGADEGTVTLTAHGVPKTGVTGRLELTTASLQGAFEGEGALKPDGLVLEGQASAKSGNASLGLLLLGLEPSPSASAVPLDLSASIEKKGDVLDITGISGTVAGEAVNGTAHFDFGGDKTRFTLKADAGAVSLPSLLGSLVAWQQTASTQEVLGTIARDASDVWPARSFALEPLTGAEGEITLNADTLTLGAPFKVDQAVLNAKINANGLTVTDLQGRLFGGSFFATGTLSPKGAGAELKAHAELAKGNLDQVSQALAGRVLAKGPFTIGLDVAGEGLSPAGLVAGLNGEGSLFVDPGVLQSLSPAPLRRVARTVLRSRKIKLDKDQIAAQTNAVRDTLTRGTYPYGAAELPFKIDNGTLKVAPATLANKAAETTINGYVELASLRVDSEWAMRLAGDNTVDLPPVNIVFAGPLADAGAISPAIDTGSIETYLTVRRMQEDVERLENLDVSGRGQPQADTDATEETAPDADTDTDNDAADATTPAAGAKLSNEKAAIEQRAAKRAAAAKAAEQKRIADQKVAVQRAAAAKRAAEKAAAERVASEKAAAEKAAAEKRAAENAAAEKAAAAKRAAEKAAAEKLAAEKAAAEKAAAEKRAAEKAAAEKAAAETRAAEKAAAEKRAAEKAAAEKAAAEKQAAEQAAAEKEAAELAAAARAAAAKASADKAAEEKAAAARAAAPPVETVPQEGPRAAVLEPGNSTQPPPPPTPDRAPEVLPWSGETQGTGASDGSVPDQPVPAAAEETPTPPPAPRVRRPRPPPAPDDWKKGISIFGGG
jgi:uncharacterized protein involved in outer membrane biogenesis